MRTAMRRRPMRTCICSRSIESGACEWIGTPGGEGLVPVVQILDAWHYDGRKREQEAWHQGTLHCRKEQNDFENPPTASAQEQAEAGLAIRCAEKPLPDSAAA